MKEGRTIVKIQSATAAAISVVLLFSGGMTAAAKGRVFLNNTQVESTLNYNGSICLPVRSFFESAGYTIQWYSAENRVMIYDSIRTITMFAGQNQIFLETDRYTLNNDIRQVNGMLVMPVEAAEKALDASIKYTDGDIYISSDATHSTTGWQYDILQLTNKIRAEHSLQSLTWNTALAHTASEHCADMVTRDYFSHNSPEGITPFDRMHSAGIRYIYAAENIAAGQPDPQSVINAWMDSPEHRANILNPNLREIGAAYSRGGTYGIYWAQEFATAG